MTMRTLRTGSLTIILLLGLLLHPAQPRTVSAAMTANDYGYLQEVLASSWVEIAAIQNEVKNFRDSDLAPNTDDGCSDANFATMQLDPFDLQFSFDYFENTYSGVYVCINGLVSFTDPSRTTYAVPIPTNRPPDNFVAPWWMDLQLVQDSHIYFHSDGSQAVIEYVNLARYSHQEDRYNFEVILSKDSNTIEFLYQSNAAVLQPVIGLENSDGWDGIQFEGMPASGQSIRYTYPASEYHHQLRPVYQSAFLARQVGDFPVEITNVGALPDTYSLSIEPGVFPAGWNVEVLDGDTGAPVSVLSNLSPGASKVVDVRVTVSAEVEPGGDFDFDLLAAGSQRTLAAQVHAVMPLPFAQIYKESSNGHVSLRSMWKRSQSSATIAQTFTGSIMALREIEADRYIAAWERLCVGRDDCSDIEFVLFGAGMNAGSAAKLTDNLAAPTYIQDVAPAMAVLPSGDIGIAFIRQIQSSFNIYLAVISPKGEVLLPPTNLTGNTDGYKSDSYQSLALTALSGDHFAVTWSTAPLSQENTNQITLAIYDYPGRTLAQGPMHVSGGISDLNYDPAAVAIGAARDQALVVFSTRDENGIYELAGTIYDAGGLVTPEFFVASPAHPDGVAGSHPVAQALGNGNLVLAWLDDVKGVSYLILDQAGTTVVREPEQLAGPGFGRGPLGYRMDAISGTWHWESGEAILTWIDLWDSYLYYAQIGLDGGATPAMYFLYEDSSLDTSRNGYGSAPFSGVAEIFLPVITR